MTSPSPSHVGEAVSPVPEEDLAPLPSPGWAEVTSPPGPGNPDLAPPGEDAGPGAGASGSQPGGSTRGSTPSPSVAKITASGLGEAMTQIFRGIGEALNHWTAQSDDDDLWLPTDAEAKGVGEPVGRIIARRVPELPPGDASDLADGITAAIPAVSYVIKNTVTWLGRRRKKRKTIPGQVTAPDLTEGATT